MTEVAHTELCGCRYRQIDVPDDQVIGQGWERVEVCREHADSVTLEGCVCGERFDCPDGWHYGHDLPCVCTPDCALDDAP